MKRVTFCGHSKMYGVSDNFEQRLSETIEQQITSGAEEFLLGGYGTFDTICAKCVHNLKEKYPHIKSVLVIPYLDRKYDHPELYDTSEYPPLENIPKKFAIIKRNEYMVEKSDILIAYVEHSWGGAAKTLEYAKKKKKTIINLAEVNN